MPREKKKHIVKVVDIVRSEKKGAPKKQEEDALFEQSRETYTDPLKELEAFRSSQNAYDNPSENTERLYAEETYNEEERTVRRKSRKKRTYILVLGCIAVAVVAYIALARMPKMDMRIVMKKSMVSYQESITVKTAIGQQNASAKEIPGEIISKKVNKVFSFTPTGTQDENQKVTGKIIVYNAYGTAPQVLVATTRFETPEGKIYRLMQRITVPGGKMNNGVLEPGSIEADIIADKVGAAYNTEPVKKLTIPGFKGSEKYEKFYGEIPNTIQTGPRATEQDIAQAQQQAESELRSDLKSLITLQIPKDVTYVPDSEEFSIVSKKVDSVLSEDKKFSVILEGEMKVFVFKESEIHTFIRQLALQAQAIQQEDVEKEFSITYKKPSLQYQSGTMQIPLDVQASYWKKVETDQLKSEIAGKKELDVKSAVLSKPGVETLSVSFWPFWVAHAPSNTERISISFE